jgi:uncharacterized protein YqjF (DUF2071 family)
MSARVPYAVMLQTWARITFLHWRYPPDQLALRLPPGLSIDTFDGSAWLGLTPFVIEGLRPPLLPPLPWISRFPETNLRTYVRGPDGAPGIWFFSLDAARAPAVVAARITYGLPYVWSRMRVTSGVACVEYRSSRMWPDRVARTQIRIEHEGALEKDALAEFLTERYRLYTTLGGKLASAAIDHVPWPLQAARVLELEQTVTDAARLGHPEGPPLAYFSEGVEARIAAPAVVT